MHRRTFLSAAGGAATGVAALGFLGERTALATVDRPTRLPQLAANTPFTLGVASGDPDHHSVVLWTRLAPEPLVPGGGLPAEQVPVD